MRLSSIGMSQARGRDAFLNLTAFARRFGNDLAEDSAQLITMTALIGLLPQWISLYCVL
jgi:hypothetical protein